MRLCTGSLVQPYTFGLGQNTESAPSRRSALTGAHIHSDLPPQRQTFSSHQSE